MSAFSAFDGPRGALALDAVLLAIAGFLALANLTVDAVPDGARQTDAGVVVLASAMVLAVLLRRISPIAMLAVSTTAWLGLTLASYPPVLPVVPVVAVFFLAARNGDEDDGRGRPELVALACTLALLAPVFMLEQPQRAEGEFHVAYLLIAAVAWIAGERVYRRRLGDREAQRGAVTAERERLSREIHDSVGHTINAIGVSAGSARLNLQSDPAVARDAIEQIETAARRAAAEMDTLLGDLDGKLPDADDIPALLAEHRARGQAIDADLASLPPADPAVGRALYRIVQESLTNAARHAPGAPVSLSINEAAGHIALAVTSGGGPADLVPGRGIGGMVSRAREVGGELSVRSHESGVVVTGRLPGGGA